ncbi:glutamate 5-kinase [Sedimentisphaera salicampi]|uniref:glutamate 5-kinase n=1 Tax=Sedimentisphaera salicampi TaxID=1941349 RepID=UPI000B9A5370|nr:glutamate 5-kinase [Sedimentisphaera salicampi]OXU14624.1 Glutamate 5-kinase [Sedimentisphaera salicampi]
MRNFSQIKRIVVKIGTNTLKGESGINSALIVDIARQVKKLHEMGFEVLLVSSGAIGMGAGRLGLSSKVKSIKMRQACAAIGQPLLMYEYSKAFEIYNIVISQVLLTAWVMDNRTSYLNLRNAVEKLLSLGSVPIINENDSISTDEIQSAFGDNDRLSALVASKVDADLLVMLSDIDRLYTKDPRKHADAEPLKIVEQLTDEHRRYAGESGSEFATGGMKTKLDAIKIASDSDCRVIITSGKLENVLLKIIDGEDIGTLFMPRRKLGSKARWILNTTPAGRIELDEGAMKAVKNHKSLLPKGIVSVDGVFEEGSVVSLSGKAKAVTTMSSDEISSLIGKHSSEIRKVLGSERKDVVALPEDIVFDESRN